jgi:hypothetical protein
MCADKIRTVGARSRPVFKGVNDFIGFSQGAGFTVSVDKPAKEQAEWFIDVERDEFATTVSWKETRGFGFYTAETGYGDRPNELYLDPLKAFERLEQMFERQARQGGVSPPWLAELRQLANVSQSDLAELVHLKQSAISRFEGRADVKLSTLVSYLGALGGRLEMRVHFDRMDVSIDFPRVAGE